MTNYAKASTNPEQFLALTGYTLERCPASYAGEFQALLPHFTARFEAYVVTHTLDGEPRQRRAYSTYTNSPLPTMEDKLFFILVYLKTANLQVVRGALFGMSQPVANKWIHRLLPIVNQALA